jgi:hypothetical protein
MAGHAIPYDSFPDVNPTGAPGGDFEHIDARPEMFGGLIGHAEQQLGQSVEKTSDDAFAVAQAQNKLNNQVYGSELHSSFSDYGMDLAAKFDQIQGKSALDQREDYIKQLQDYQKEVESRATNPELKAMVATNTRNTMDRISGWMTRHAEEQQQKWHTETAKRNIDSATGMGGMAILNNDYGALDQQLIRITAEAHNYYDPQGYDKQTLDGEVERYKGQAIKNWVETAATNDKDPDNLTHALQIFERYSGQVDPTSRLEISKFINTKAQARTVERISDFYIGGAKSSPFMPQIVESATKYDINPALLAKQLYQESGLNPNVRPSSAGAQGVAQFIPGTAARYGVNVHDTASSIEGAAHYMSDLKAQFGGNDGLALAGYNWGENHVAAWLAQGGNPAAMPAETRNYVRSITGQPIEAWLSGKARTNVNQIDVDDVVSRIQNDPAFKDRPELQQEVIRNVVQKASMLNRADALKNKQIKDQSDNAEWGYFNQIHTDDPNLTLRQILSDQRLDREARERLVKGYEERGGNTKTDHTYGPAFYDIYNRVHLPEGNPQRITDPNELYSHVGPNGDLTVGGVDKLRSEIEGRKTPEGTAESAMKKNFLEMAETKIAPTNALGIKLPKTNEDFQRFLTWFFPEYEKQRAAGKSAVDLLNPKSKDYLGSGIDAGYMSSTAKQYQEYINHLNDEMATPVEGAKPSPFDINSIKTLDQAKAAYSAGNLTRVQARALALAHPDWGVTFAPPAPARPQVPISNNARFR